MPAKVYSATILGIRALPIEVEVDVASGLHQFSIVGLPDKAIQESRDRVSSAIKNSGALPPNKQNRRITVNLAPADIKKEGVAYDLAIAVGYLLATKQMRSFETEDKIFVGELALDGKIRRVSGILPIALMANKHKFKYLILPKDNAKEASVVQGIKIIPAENLDQLIEFLERKRELTEFRQESVLEKPKPVAEFDFSQIHGQFGAKRVLEIAAAGGHNVLMSGPPGSGKTMLSRALPSILPPMSLEEALEVTQIYSVAGLTDKENPIIWQRPFRAPHHTASHIALIGGGSWPKPGEISLAHRGVLFLDEFPEFPKNVLEGLRQPMEDGKVTISRAQRTVTLPASFMLIGAMNPCPCGFYGDPEKECQCSPGAILRYQRKISGPLLDRIDLQVEVPRVHYVDFKNKDKKEEGSAEIRERVLAARQIQKKRFKDAGLKILTNSEMNSSQTEKFCIIDQDGEDLLKNAIDKDYLSARGYYRILKVARTIADLEGRENISKNLISEALSYRVKNEK